MGTSGQVQDTRINLPTLALVHSHMRVNRLLDRLPMKRLLFHFIHWILFIMYSNEMTFLCVS